MANRRIAKKKSKATFEDQLIESAKQAVAIKKGELAPSRAYTLPRVAERP